jgi:tetratricopeptide (TPR) repeat protein
MKSVWIAILALFSLSAMAPAQEPDPRRIEAIWGYANQRLVEQSDVWFDDGEFPRTIQLLRIHHALEPADYEIVTNLGWLLESTEAHDEALATYVGFRKNRPEDPDAAYPEAYFYFSKRAFAKVPPLIEPTLAGRPHPNSFRILAHSYERLNLLKDSQRVWKMYLELMPDDGAAKVNLQRVERKIRGDQT